MTDPRDPHVMHESRSPSTEAGRQLATLNSNEMEWASVEPEDVTRLILAIEEAARTEGRREAVQLVRPVAEKALTYAGGSKFAADAARKVLATLDMAEG